MTAVYRQIINHPSAWTTKSVGDKEGLVFDLTNTQINEIDKLLARTRHLRPQQATREDFSSPMVNELLAELRDEVMDGRGLVVVRGLTRERYDEEDFERIYWGFGTHWGNAAVQSMDGSRLRHVRFEANNPHQRGHLTTNELQPHTDAYEIVGLMCVQRAESGGHSRMVSTLAVHNEIMRTRPELLDVLYRGFPTAVVEAKQSANPVTPYNVPIFSCVDGKVSCVYSRQFMRAAEERLGRSIPDDLAKALAVFDTLLSDDRFRLHFMLEPGEMMIWNNFTIMHSRTSFEDSATRKRDLLRLWLNVPNGRPAVPEIFTWGRTYDGLFEEHLAKATA
jgi:hypothetical protein